MVHPQTRLRVAESLPEPLGEIPGVALTRRALQDHHEGLGTGVVVLEQAAVRGLDTQAEYAALEIGTEQQARGLPGPEHRDLQSTRHL